MISGPQVWKLQGAPSAAPQARNLLTANNATRIIVPISTIKNASSASAQTGNGLTFPAWLTDIGADSCSTGHSGRPVAETISGDKVGPAGVARPSNKTTGPPKEGGSQLHAITIEHAEGPAESKAAYLSSARGQRFTTIPIETLEESTDRITVPVTEARPLMLPMLWITPFSRTKLLSDAFDA